MRDSITHAGLLLRGEYPSLSVLLTWPLRLVPATNSGSAKFNELPKDGAPPARHRRSVRRGFGSGLRQPSWWVDPMRGASADRRLSVSSAGRFQGPVNGRYNTTSRRVEGRLNVHIVPHTHDGMNWGLANVCAPRTVEPSRSAQTSGGSRRSTNITTALRTASSALVGSCAFMRAFCLCRLYETPTRTTG